MTVEYLERQQECILYLLYSVEISELRSSRLLFSSALSVLHTCTYVYSDTSHITPTVPQCTHLMLCESSAEMTNTALNLNTHKLG